jgi:hypothetical protein
MCSRTDLVKMDAGSRRLKDQKSPSLGPTIVHFDLSRYEMALRQSEVKDLYVDDDGSKFKPHPEVTISC